MDISLILKVAGTGLLVSVICQILNKSGRDEMAMLVSLSGIIIVLMLLTTQISDLLSTIKNVFGI